MVSSNASSNCHIEWRPSRALVSGLLVLGALAGLAIMLSDLDSRLAWPAALLCLGWGLRGASRQWQKPALGIRWSGAGEPALITSAAERWELQAVSLHWRGPLAVLAGRDGKGHSHRIVFYPDTLDGAGRRALRLAAGRRPATPNALAVALS